MNTGRIKAISVQQPYASMIADGEKTIETRRWTTRYRGELLIVSSKRPAIEPAGYALAIVKLAACRLMRKRDEKAACCPIYPGARAWLLEDIRKIEPFPVTGQLGIYEVKLLEEPVYVEVVKPVILQAGPLPPEQLMLRPRKGGGNADV